MSEISLEDVVVVKTPIDTFMTLLNIVNFNCPTSVQELDKKAVEEARKCCCDGDGCSNEYPNCIACWRDALILHKEYSNKDNDKECNYSID